MSDLPSFDQPSEEVEDGLQLGQARAYAPPMGRNTGDPLVRVGVLQDPPDLVERHLKLAQDADLACLLDLVAAKEAIAVLLVDLDRNPNAVVMPQRLRGKASDRAIWAMVRYSVITGTG